MPAGRRQPRHLAHVRHGLAATLFDRPARPQEVSFTGSTEVGKELIRLSAEQVKRLSPRARRPRAVRDLRRRRPRAGRRRPDRLEVPQRRPDLRLREPRLRPARHLRRGPRSGWPRRSRSWRSAPARADGVTIGPLIDDRAVEKVRGARQGRGRATARRWWPAASACTAASFAGRLVLRADRARRRHRRHADLPRGDVRPGRRPHAVRRRGRGDPHGQRHRLRPRRVLPHARLRAPAARGRAARLRHRRRQRRHHLGRQRAVRRRQGVGLRPRGRLRRHRRVPRRSSTSASAASGSSAVRAMRQLVYGEPLVLQNVPEPQCPARATVVIDVTRAAVNPLDVWVSRGTVAAAGPLPRTGGSRGRGRDGGGAPRGVPRRRHRRDPRRQLRRAHRGAGGGARRRAGRRSPTRRPRASASPA